MSMSVLLGLGLLWSGVADARPPRRPHVRPPPRPRVVVRPSVSIALRIAPWLIGYRPPPRPGYVWIAGYWQGPHYIPGHWRPTAQPPQPHYVWVEGHWEDDTYVDGYWRIDEIDGILWVDGEYLEDEYVEGHWEDSEGNFIPTDDLPDETYLPADPESDTPLAVPFEETPSDTEEPELHHAPPTQWR